MLKLFHIIFRVDPADAEFLPTDLLLEEDNEDHMYNSVKQSGGVRHRPSFLMSILNSNFGQSIRKRSSIYKADSFREGQGHTNPAFMKYTSYKNSSPTNSRSSSTAKRPSPTHSRASSVSFQPCSISRHRHKSFDVSRVENSLANGANPECEGTGIMSAMTAAVAPVIPNFEVYGDKSSNILENDVGMQKMDSYMPSIPEEPSRIMSTASVGSTISESPQNDVQALVAEASKVLEELNKAVRGGKHNKDSSAKDYESCCSLSSDESSEDEEDQQNRETGVRNSIAVEMPNDHQLEFREKF